MKRLPHLHAHRRHRLRHTLLDLIKGLARLAAPLAALASLVRILLDLRNIDGRR